VPQERKRDGVVYLPCIKPEPRRTIGLVYRTFNYPTMAEAYRVAALNGLNRLF
jgi:LysR family hydrogen peroxide-inducible transcriptional activator